MDSADRLQQRPVNLSSGSPQSNAAPSKHAGVLDEAAKMGPKAPAAGSSPEAADLDVIDRIASPTAEHTVDQRESQHEDLANDNRCRAFRSFCRTSGAMEPKPSPSAATLHATPAS